MFFIIRRRPAVGEVLNGGLVGPEGFEPSTFGFPLQKLFIPSPVSKPKSCFLEPDVIPG